MPTSCITIFKISVTLNKESSHDGLTFQVRFFKERMLNKETRGDVFDLRMKYLHGKKLMEWKP